MHNDLFNLFLIKDAYSLDVNLRGYFSFFSNDKSGTLEATLRGYIDNLS